MRRLFISVVIALMAITTFGQIDNSSNIKSLITASPISVTIGGNFIVTGTFQASANERVDQFVTRIFNTAKDKLYGNVKEPEELILLNKQLDDYSIRNVTLKRISGEKQVLDLLRFREEGDFSNNPYLKNEDVLIFPASDLEYNYFWVSGAVNKPGKYHFIDGDKLSDAIRLSKGINKAFENVDIAEIHRLSYDGSKQEILKIKLNSDVELKRGDRIVLGSEEPQRKMFTIKVYGEVRKEGEVPVTKNNTTLRDVLINAGGVTENADLKRAKVFKESIFNFLIKKKFNIPETEVVNNGKLLESQFYWNMMEYDYLQLFRMTTLTNEDSVYFLIENRLKNFGEATSFSLENYMDENSDAANYKLREGDIVVIPPKPTTVFVFGQVANPGHLNYKAGEKFDYYIGRAGGYGPMSIVDEIKVIKGNSKLWVDPDSTTIEPGDLIFVPRDFPISFNEYVRRFGSYISILGSVATIILLLVQLGK